MQTLQPERFFDYFLFTSGIFLVGLQEGEKKTEIRGGKNRSGDGRKS